MGNRGMSDKELDPETGMPARAGESGPKGHGVNSLGPSDSSDSGSDMVGYGSEDTSDRNGTGEHLAAGDDLNARVANDIAPDRIVGAEGAGLGGGLDQAEEAQLGITDEEIAQRVHRKRH